MVSRLNSNLTKLLRGINTGTRGPSSGQNEANTEEQGISGVHATEEGERIRPVNESIRPLESGSLQEPPPLIASAGAENAASRVIATSPCSSADAEMRKKQ